MPVHDWTRVDAGIFHDFHTVWLVALRNRLNHLLPPEYYAMSEQKAFGLGPDVVALGHNRTGANGPTGGGDASHGPPAGALSLKAAPPQVRFALTHPAPEPAYKRRWIAVRHVSGDRVVAVVEIVSPGNKASRDALRAFTAKAAEFLEYGVHLLVIDLFPPTPRDPQGIHHAIRDEFAGNFVRPPDKPLTLVSYQAGAEERSFIEPIAFGDSLPDMPLFLDGDLYVLVPLESTYAAAFAEVPRRWQEDLTGPAS